jgi:hypothetical protein
MRGVGVADTMETMTASLMYLLLRLWGFKTLLLGLTWTFKRHGRTR